MVVAAKAVGSRLLGAVVNALKENTKVFMFEMTGAKVKGKYVGDSEFLMTNYFRCAQRMAKAFKESSGQEAFSMIVADEIDSIEVTR